MYKKKSSLDASSQSSIITSRVSFINYNQCYSPFKPVSQPASKCLYEFNSNTIYIIFSKKYSYYTLSNFLQISIRVFAHYSFFTIQNFIETIVDTLLSLNEKFVIKFLVQIVPRIILIVAPMLTTPELDQHNKVIVSPLCCSHYIQDAENRDGSRKAVVQS